MATPTRTRFRFDAPDGPREAEMVSAARSGAAPLVVLVGSVSPALLARAEGRLARAGFSVIAAPDDLGTVGAMLAAASAGRFGSVPTALAMVGLPGLPATSAERISRLPGVKSVLAWPAGAEDESLDTVVRVLASQLP
jgi:hypothetical protein